MNDASVQAAAALVLPDAAYRGTDPAPFAAAEAGLRPPLGRPGDPPAPMVFALGLVSDVRPEKGETVPGALGLRLHGQRRWEVAFEQNIIFIITDLTTGAVRAAGPYLPDKRMQVPEPSASGPAPSADAARATLSGLERFTLPALFGERWPSAGYSVTALYYDWRSNTAVVRRDPAPIRGRAHVRAESAFLTALAPEPDSAGLSFTLPADLRPGATGLAVLRVAAAAADLAIVQATPEPGPLVMAATLLLVRLDDTVPVAIELGVPVVQAGDRMTAAVSFDLGRHAQVRKLAGLYQAYLVSGRSVAGPVGVTFRP